MKKITCIHCKGTGMLNVEDTECFACDNAFDKNKFCKKHKLIRQEFKRLLEGAKR